MKTTVSLLLPEKVPAVLGQQVTVTVGVTDFSGTDREILVRLIGSLSGPLPAVNQLLRAHLSAEAEVSMQVPAGMPPGAHPILIEVLDRSTGSVIGHGEVILDVQRTQAIRMHLSPPSIRRRLSGRIRVVLRNHDDETHNIRLRAETDDDNTKVKLWNQEVELRAGEMVRLKAKLKVKPFFIGKQREHWYSIIGDGAGTPIYGRGNVRHIPMIGRNIKSLMGLMCIVLVWAGATLAVIRAVNPVTSESAASANEGQENTTDGDGTTGGELELPNLIDVSGTVTAVPDGSNVTVKWRTVNLGDVEGSGKIGGQSTATNPNIASLTTTTNADGAFSVAGLDGEGLYEFTFAKAGHATKTLIVQPQGEAVALEVELAVGDGKVSGFTVDEKGQVLGGVDVTLTDGIITYQTTTPTDGEQKGSFSFLNLSTPSTYVIDARVSQRGLASNTFNLDAGSSKTDLILALSPNVATLAGRVSSMLFELGGAAIRQTAEQNPNIPNFTVPAVTIVATDGVTTRSTTTLTDIELAGTFRLLDLPINRVYTVTYSVDGFTTYTETVELTFDTPDRDISLNRSTGRLSGVVTVESPDILPQSVAITIANGLQTYKSSDLVRSDGSYDFNGIAPGNYVATFEALGLKDQYREIEIGAGTTTKLDVTLTEVDDTSKSSSLSFVATKNGEALTSLTPAPVTVTVKHRAADDCGQVGAESSCVYATEINPGTATTTVKISNLDAGAYYLVFTADGFSPKTVQTSVALGEQKDQIAVTLDALGTLSGQVTDDSGSPVEGVQLRLTSATGVTKTGGTGPNGEFTFPNSLDAMTYTLDTTSPNFTSVSRTVTGALNASVNVDATVRGISMITGEVRSLNLASGNYEAVEAKNFSVFYRISPTGSTLSTGGWVDTKTIGISKSLGSFRLGVNPKDQNNNTIFIDACVTIIDGTIAGTVMSSAACDSSLLKSAMPPGLIAKTSTTVSLQPGETVVRSVYFTPSPGSVSGYVTVGDVAENNLKIEARRIGPDGRIYETVNATSTTNTSSGQSGYYIFEYLTPTSSVAPAEYNENVFVPCDQTANICWSIRATKTSVGSSDSRPFSIYPSKRLNLPAAETIDIELGRGSASVTLSADTGLIFSDTTLNLTATINGVAKTSSVTTNANGKAVFSNLEIGTWTLSLPATDDYALVNREFNITQGVSLNESVVRRSLRGKLIVYLRGPGGPLSGAEIRLAPSSDSTTTTTMPTSTTTTIAGTLDPTVLCVSVADGSCTINNYDTGVHTFVASATGLSSTTISASVIGGQTIAVSIVLGAASGSLTVTLLDVLGEPLAEATITAKDQSLKDYVCTTSVLGICTLTEIPFGIVDVRSTATNFRDSFGSISVGTGGSAMTLIATPTNGKATFVFVDDNGQGLLSAKAQYINSAGEVLQTCTTPTTPPASNQCIMTGLPQGLVTIRATVTGLDASQYAPVTLRVSVFPGLDTAATFVIPTANAALAGTVVEDESDDSSSVLISGSIVTATDAAGKSEVTLTDDAGRYSFSTLTPGSWTIRATAPGYATKTLSAVSLPNQNFEIRLVPLSGSIELSVRTPIGGPASGITVTVQRMIASADIYSIVTSNDGNAFFAQDTIVEGTYTVTISDSIIPARYVSQTFVLNVDRGAATRFATYLGTFGAFVAVPISGIPASGFGPATPLSVDVALIKNGVLMHQISTEMVASQRVASFAGVAPGQYSIAIQSPGLIASSTPISINNVVRNFTDKVRFTTSSDHGLVLGDFVDISGFAKTIFNFDNAEVTEYVDARTFSVSRVTGTVPLPVGDEYANAKMVKVSNQTQWNLAAHTIKTNSITYDVPSASTIEVPELSRTIALGVINLIVKPVDFDVVVSGIAFTDPSITTTTTPTSTTLPLLDNAKVTLSDGYLLNSVSSTTNSSGVANFTDIPPGTYTATVTNTAYDDFVTTIQVVDFADPAGNNPRISLNQTPITGKIKVTVFGDGNSSNFVSGATVSVLENNATCVTDSSGICALNNLTQGDYNLRVIHPSYSAINTEPIHVTGGLETTHSVGLGSNEGRIDFTVFNSATGSPIASSEITAQVSGAAPSCTTDASGKCSVTELALGATSFRIVADNFSPGFVGVDVTGGIPGKVTVNLNPSNNVLIINTVDAVTGSALSGVEIATVAESTTICVTQGASANCTSPALTTGNYSLKISKENYEDLYSTVLVLANDPTSLTFALRPTLGKVDFIIKDAATGAPIPGANVESLSNVTDACTTPTGLGTSGRCTISNLSLIATQFAITATGYNGSTTNVTVTNVGGSETTILLNKDSVGFKVYTFDAVSDLPLNGVTVQYADGETFCSSVTATGFCSPAANIPGGTITLKAFKDNAYLPIFITTTFNTSVPASISLALLPTNGSVQISVVDGNDDSEINGVTITRSPSESVCTTSSNSGCAIPSMPVGTYVFTATKAGYTTATITATIANSDVSYLSMIMYPITNSQLRVYTYDASTGSSLDGVSVSPSCGSATSSGYCTANNVATGQLTITASRSGYDPAYGNVMIESGGSETVHLYLRPTASTLTVTVLNSFSNAAIPSAWVTITGGSCGYTSGSGVIACTGFTSGNLSLSVSAGNFNSATATIGIGRGSTNSVILFLTPLGQLTVSTPMTSAVITATLPNFRELCSIRALTEGESATSGSCTGYNLPYGTYIVVLNTSPAKTATVTITSASTSINIA
jgi:uncharacterized protein (DUF2141 family)